MRPSVPNANALMSSSTVCSGFSKSTTCDRAAGTLQHPNTAHTSAHNPRSHRNRLREHGQIIDCLWSSLRFEYAHHQLDSVTHLLATCGQLRHLKSLGKDVHPGQPSFQNPPKLPTPLNLSNPAQNNHSYFSPSRPAPRTFNFRISSNLCRSRASKP